jgi:hypothetical protein
MGRAALTLVFAARAKGARGGGHRRCFVLARTSAHPRRDFRDSPLAGAGGYRQRAIELIESRNRRFAKYSSQSR